LFFKRKVKKNPVEIVENNTITFKQDLKQQTDRLPPATKLNHAIQPHPENSRKKPSNTPADTLFSICTKRFFNLSRTKNRLAEIENRSCQARIQGQMSSFQ
jgi:hypothetical protein